jgi:hypothetical protein
MRVQSGSTDQVLHFVAVDATDLNTREPTLTGFTVYRKRKAGAVVAWTTPTITELSSSNMPGVYGLLIDEDTTIDAGDDEQQVVLHITHASMAPVTITYELFRPKITAGATLATSDVAAIKARTDNLPSDPADASDLAALFAAVNSTLATIAGYIDTEVAAIKAKTDNLPASPAAVGSAMTLTAGERNAIADAALVRQLAESYRADGTAPTLAQALCELLAHMGEATIAGTTKTLRKFDGSTSAATFTLDDATTPTSITRAS